jgi:hypothetical protein
MEKEAALSEKKNLLRDRQCSGASVCYRIITAVDAGGRLYTLLAINGM